MDVIKSHPLIVLCILNPAQTVKPLTHEWQLGASLNESVRGGDREQFRLLLAMLSDDTQDQVQFQKLAKEPLAEKALREQFELQKPQNFYAESDELQHGEAAKLAIAQDTMALLLKNCLHPEPLTGPQVIGPGLDVMNNLSPLQQHKQRVLQGKELPSEPELDWLKADQALLKMLNQQKLVA